MNSSLGMVKVLWSKRICKPTFLQQGKMKKGFISLKLYELHTSFGKVTIDNIYLLHFMEISVAVNFTLIIVMALDFMSKEFSPKKKVMENFQGWNPGKLCVSASFLILSSVKVKSNNILKFRKSSSMFCIVCWNFVCPVFIFILSYRRTFNSIYLSHKCTR